MKDEANSFHASPGRKEPRVIAAIGAASDSSRSIGNLGLRLSSTKRRDVSRKTTLCQWAVNAPRGHSIRFPQQRFDPSRVCQEGIVLMRAFTVAALMLIVAAPPVAGAQTAPAPAAAAPAVALGAAGYSVADTELGVLLDDPAAKALLDKYLPGLSSNEQIDMARSMTLKSLQQYKPDVLTDSALAALQADLSKLPAKK